MLLFFLHLLLTCAILRDIYIYITIDLFIYSEAKDTCITEGHTEKQKNGESMSAAIWSDFESIVLSEIVSPFSEPQQDATILRLYNDIVYYSTAPFCIFFLPDVITFREKNYTQLHAKLQH